MRRALALALAVLAATGPPARAADQDAIDKAVERGVAFLRGGSAPGANDVTQPAGATALMGVTLLYCGFAPDDKAVQAAAAVFRQAGLSKNQTFSMALGILFLDRLGDPDDVPLIESMTVGAPGGSERRRGLDLYLSLHRRFRGSGCLTLHLRQQTELIGRRDPPKGPMKDKDKDKDDQPKRRTVKDLPKEIQEQLVLINRMAGLQPPGMTGDNSNTQFATVALWVARRHGLPVDLALGRINQRYRASQNADGGWAYTPVTGPGVAAMPMNASTATMTSVPACWVWPRPRGWSRTTPRTRANPARTSARTAP